MRITLKRKIDFTLGQLNQMYGLTVRKGEIGRVSKSRAPSLNITNCSHLCEYALTYGKAPHPRTVYFERPKPRVYPK